MAARMDAARYGRIWELAIRGARTARHRRPARPSTTEDLAGVTIRALRAHARRGALRRPRRADHGEGRGRRPAQPRARRGRLRAASLPPGRRPPRQAACGSRSRSWRSARSSSATSGLADVFTRRDIRAPGPLDVEIGGKRGRRRPRRASTMAGCGSQAPTTPGPADVTFVASATAPQRLICFAAEARQ